MQDSSRFLDGGFLTLGIVRELTASHSNDTIMQPFMQHEALFVSRFAPASRRMSVATRIGISRCEMIN